ncbi:hypothetical protein JVT61DRAFT_3701 [Boletus reticuloceps]|uniref:Ubiquitin-like protease family profile domain-containing protein n=1 Tax=Boletus reticuloceps TaxID=495285 RepID=A0A8I3A9P3_9AGAM|nr:hypothetical protein JVT61DRAFT_3701 [Boletus reticuloceps]
MLLTTPQVRSTPAYNADGGIVDTSSATLGGPSLLNWSAAAFPPQTCSQPQPWNGGSEPTDSHRGSPRQPRARSSKDFPLVSPLAELEAVLEYLFTGNAALTITQSDLRRLQPKEYLNDTLIEFGLGLWLDDLRMKDQALAEQIYVFSPFFYSQFSRKQPIGAAALFLTPLLTVCSAHNLEDGYKSMRRWTSKVNLFKKKYIVVPINEE